jgi:flagellar hook protein FlgE
MGFGQGLSGLNAASTDLDVIGNNIANAQTAGFRQYSVAFADVFASSRVGLGVNVAAIKQNSAVGNISAGGTYDIAIDGQKGFFRLADSSGAIVYSRNGQFSIDKDFYIVNNQGYRLTGYPVGGIGGTPIAVRLPQGNVAPQATTRAGIETNLNANATPITAPFAHTVRDTYTNAVPMTVYDSLGNPHPLTQYFVKRDAVGGQSRYEVFHMLDNGVPATPASTILTFDDAGRITNPPPNPTLTFTLGGGDSPAQNLSIAMNYSSVTQYGSGFNPKVTQNGYTSGELAGVSFGKDGNIVGSYTNGQTQVIGTVALADFNNVQGLQPTGNNAWVESADSGSAILGQPGTNGLAVVRGQAFEESNVDMSQQLVSLIISQRWYQANAKTIEAQNEILQTLITRL